MLHYNTLLPCSTQPFCFEVVREHRLLVYIVKNARGNHTTRPAPVVQRRNGSITFLLSPANLKEACLMITFHT